MKFQIKLFSILMIVLFITGCANRMPISCWWSSCEQKAVLDKNKNPVQDKFGNAEVVISKKPKSVGLATQTTKAIEAVAEVEVKKLELLIAEEKNRVTSPCLNYTPAEVAALGKTAQDSYLITRNECVDKQVMAGVIHDQGKTIRAMAKDDSDIQTLAKTGANQVIVTEEQGTQKVIAATTLGLGATISRDNRKSNVSSHKALANVGIAGSENAGDITANVQTGQYVSTSSTDSGAAAGGPGGMGPGGAGTSGNATVTNTLSSGGDTVNIGRKIKSNDIDTSDNARALVDANTSQIIEPSGNGQITDGSKTNGTVTADDFEGDSTTNDEDSLLEL